MCVTCFWIMLNYWLELLQYFWIICCGCFKTLGEIRLTGQSNIRVKERNRVYRGKITAVQLQNEYSSGRSGGGRREQCKRKTDFKSWDSFKEAAGFFTPMENRLLQGESRLSQSQGAEYPIVFKATQKDFHGGGGVAQIPLQCPEIWLWLGLLAETVRGKGLGDELMHIHPLLLKIVLLQCLPAGSGNIIHGCECALICLQYLRFYKSIFEKPILFMH